jgi:hypothetical protein
MKIIWRYTLLFPLIIADQQLSGYGLPRINLGSNNILDGGPIRPKPGFYWQEAFQYYHSDNFLDHRGKKIDGCSSPSLDSVVIANQLVYQAKPMNCLHGSLGAVISIPVVPYSHVSNNKLNRHSASVGCGNPAIGCYLQFNPIEYNNRPFFVHRIELDVFLPVGTNKFPKKTLNPAAIMTYIDPYWAATLFISEKLATSWRMHYLWCARNKKTNIKPGQTFHINYSLEYEIIPKLFIAASGYYLQQLYNDKLCAQEIPHSKERILGIGPGALYFLPKNYYLFGYLYFEKMARNRPQGIRAVMRLVKYF